MGKWFIALAVCTLTLACSTPLPVALDRLKVGIEKPELLDRVGSPSRTFRENGQDHWVYVYYRNDKQWLRDVVLEDGRVQRVGRPIATDPRLKELQNADSLEDYEKKVRAQQKKSKFKNVDGN
jgi:hypothetical protein